MSSSLIFELTRCAILVLAASYSLRCFGLDWASPARDAAASIAPCFKKCFKKSRRRLTRRMISPRTLHCQIHRRAGKASHRDHHRIRSRRAAERRRHREIHLGDAELARRKAEELQERRNSSHSHRNRKDRFRQTRRGRRRRGPIGRALAPAQSPRRRLAGSVTTHARWRARLRRQIAIAVVEDARGGRSNFERLEPGDLPIIVYAHHRRTGAGRIRNLEIELARRNVQQRRGDPVDIRRNARGREYGSGLGGPAGCGCGIRQVRIRKQSSACRQRLCSRSWRHSRPW